MNQIEAVNHTIAFLPLYYLARYYHTYHVTTSLPVDHANDKSDGLNDLTTYRPDIQSKLQQLAPGFGSNQIGMNCGAWYAHNHTLHVTDTEIQDIAFTEAMLTAQLPWHLRRLEKGTVIKIQRVKRTALDILNEANYLADHNKLDRTRYDRYTEKSSYGKWPTLDDLDDDTEDEEEEAPKPTRKRNKNVGKEVKKPAYEEFCQQDIKVFFAILFLTMSGVSDKIINELSESAIRGVYSALFAFESDPLSDQSEPEKIAREKIPAADPAAAGNVTFDPFDLSDPEDADRIQRLRASDLAEAFIVGGPSAVRELLDKYELYARIVAESNAFFDDIPPAPETRRPVTVASSALRASTEEPEDKAEPRQASMSLIFLPLFPVFCRWMFPFPRGPGPPASGKKSARLDQTGG